MDAGGAFGLLVRDRNNTDQDGAPKLADIRRFENEREKAASLRLRRGDTEAIDLYDEQGRIIGGDHDDMLDAAYHAWQTDVAAGRSSILIAETTETVTALNPRARADRILGGQAAAEGVGLHDGTVAGRGDTIATRGNDRRLTTGRGWVKNDDTWTVTESHEDGSLTVQRPGSHGRRGRITLSADYMAEHVELGYAITAHRAQGATVDTAHLVVHSSSMTSEAFYVTMTRGRLANVAYGVLQHEGAEKSAHETIEAEQEKWSSIAQLAASGRIRDHRPSRPAPAVRHRRRQQQPCPRAGESGCRWGLVRSIGRAAPRPQPLTMRSADQSTGGGSWLRRYSVGETP